MFNISNYPRGLPALLGIRERGETMRSLADAVSAVIDTTPFYLLNEMENLASAVVAAPAVGTQVPLLGGAALTVPEGQVWYLHGIYAFITLGAGQTIRMTPGVRFAVVPIFYDQPQLFPANTLAIAPGGLLSSRWLPSGATLVVGVSEITGAPANLFLNAVISRFRS